MANDFTKNPWTIDTPYSTPATAAPGALNNHITNSYVFIKSITWSDQVAAGDQLIITDRNGKLIQDIKAQGANVALIINNPEWVNGFLVPTLASGKLSVVVQK